jgi:hypothetical protein
VHACICPYLLLVCRRICRRDCLEGSAQRFALCVRDAELANQIVVLAHVEERAPVNVVICWRLQRMWRWDKREVRKKYAQVRPKGAERKWVRTGYITGKIGCAHAISSRGVCADMSDHCVGMSACLRIRTDHINAQHKQLRLCTIGLLIDFRSEERATHL